MNEHELKATFLTSGKEIPEFEDYEYPATNEGKEELVEKNLLKYKEKLENQLKKLIPKDNDIEVNY